jgi:hypothetical protein
MTAKDGDGMDVWEEFEEIASSEDFNARERFMLRDDLPDDLVREIIQTEGDVGILSSLASNKNLKLEFLEDLFLYRGAIAKEEDPEESVFYGLAENPSAGKGILEQLANHENDEIAESAQQTLSKL